MSYLLSRRFPCVALCMLLTAGAAAVEAADKPDGHEKLPDGAALRLGSAHLRHGEHTDGLVVLGGKSFATVGEHQLIVWDAETGHATSSYSFPPWPEAYLRSRVAYPAEGAVAAFADGSALVCARAGGATLHKLPLDKHPPVPLPVAEHDIVAVALSAKKDTVLAVTAKGGLLEWRVGDGKWTALRSPLREPRFDVHTILASGGGVVAVLDGNKSVRLTSVRLWNTAKGRNARTQDTEYLETVAISADGKRFITLDHFGSRADVRTVADQQGVSGWKAPQGTSAVALSPDGAVAALGYTTALPRGRNQVDLYDAATGKLQRTLLAPRGVKRLAFLPDGSLITVSGGGFIQLWDMATGKPRHLPVGHTGGVRRVRYVPGGGWVTAGADGILIAWDATGGEVRRFEGHSGPVTGLELSNDGKTLYSAGVDRTVREWDATTGKERRSCTVERGATQATRPLALSPGGKWLAVGVERCEVRLLDVGELKVVKSLAPEVATKGGGTYGVAFASDELLVSYDTRQKVRVWDTAKGELHDIRVGTQVALSIDLAPSPDGKTIALPVVRDGLEPREELFAPATEVGFWDILTGKSLGRLKPGAGAHITTIAYLPDGKAMAVGDSAGVVSVYDLATKKVRHTFTGHRGPVLCLSASPDGKTLASGGSDTTVLVWKLDSP